MNELRSADVSISKLQDFSLASPDPQGRSWVSHPNDEVLFSLANKLCTLNFLKQKHSCCGAVNKDQLHWISKKPWDHNFRRELSFSKSIKSNEARAEWSFEKHILYVIKIDDLHEKATTANHRFPHSPTPVGIWWWRVGMCGWVWESFLPQQTTDSHTCGNLWFRVGGLCVEPLFF